MRAGMARRGAMPGPVGERGAATVFAAFGLLALLALTALCVQVAGAVVAGHRAQAAADLSALAAAGALADGEDACAAARESARANGARIGACEVEGQAVLVRALVRLPMTALPGPSEADADARARWSVAAGSATRHTAPRGRPRGP